MSASNPIPALRAQLAASLYLINKTPSYNLQLYLNSGLLAASLVCVLASLVIRWFRGSFWVFRRITTASGNWILPHPMIFFLIWESLFLIVMQGYLYMSKDYGIVGSDLTHIMLWRNLVWLPLYIGGWGLAWATLLGPITSRPASSRSRLDLAHYPLFVNIFFISIPIILSCLVIPLSIISSSIFNRAFKVSQGLDAALVKASNGLENGSLAPAGLFAELAPLVSVSTALKLDFVKIVRAWKHVWFVWSSFTAFFFIVFLLAAFTYFRSLRYSIRSLRIKSSKSSSSGAYADQLRSLNMAYYSLAFTSALIGIIGLCYVIMAATLAFRTEEIASGTKLTQVIGLGSLYTFSTWGTVSSVVILVRSFNRPPARLPSFESINKDTINGTSSLITFGRIHGVEFTNVPMQVRLSQGRTTVEESNQKEILNRTGRENWI